MHCEGGREPQVHIQSREFFPGDACNHSPVHSWLPQIWGTHTEARTSSVASRPRARGTVATRTNTYFVIALAHRSCSPAEGSEKLSAGIWLIRTSVQYRSFSKGEFNSLNKLSSMDQVDRLILCTKSCLIQSTPPSTIIVQSTSPSPRHESGWSTPLHRYNRCPPPPRPLSFPARPLDSPSSPLCLL